MASGPNTAPIAPATIDIRDYFRVLRRYRRLIAFITIAFVALALLYSLITPKKYTSKSVVSVKPVGIALTDAANTDLSKTVSMTTEQSIASSTSVASIAKQTLSFPGTPQSLLKRESVT